MQATIPTDSAKHALLTALIDDAGLFPPAALPMTEAVRAHARHAESAYAWIGGRFVLPASRVDEFLALYDGTPIALAIILDAATLGAKGDVLRADLHRADRAAARDGVTVEAFEARIPGGLDADGLRTALAAVAEHVPDRPVGFWYELAHAGSGWTQPLDATMRVLAETRASASAHVTLGAKLRCGGATPSAVPSIGDVAGFLAAAQTHGVPWKATAGLHHPVRHVTPAGAEVHGFLNLFVAGVLLHAGAIDAGRVRDVIAEEDPRAFVVDPLHVAWRGASAAAEAVTAARVHCTSYGSCSFAEPVNDLRERGIVS